MKYVIEHLEKGIGKWCLIEYFHISAIVGKENLIFTNMKNGKKIKLLGKTTGKKAKDFLSSVDPEKVCLLDPGAETTLLPEDRFEFLVFGGILGDYPPKQRTKKLMADVLFQKRNLGREQMCTDTAVHVAFLIAEKGKNLSELRFKDSVEILMAENESVELPYRFLLDSNNNPIIAPGLKQYLKNKKKF